MRCDVCKKEIDSNEVKHVLLGTYEGDKTLKETWYHFDCFVKWYNSKVKEKAKNQVEGMRDKARGVFDGLASNPMVKGFLASNPQLTEMFNTEIKVDDMPDFDEILGKKEKNGTKSNRKTKK